MSEFAVERRIKHQKLKRKARRGEIAIRRLYKIVRFMFILFIFYSAYRLCNAHYWYLPMNLYEKPVKEHIEIIGNNIVPDEKILEQMKKIPLKKEQLYKFNPAETTNSIEQLTPVKRAYIRRYWLPARLSVMIEEVTPIFTISPSEDAPDVAAFAISGELIPREYLPLNPKFKVTKLLTYGTNGDDYENWDIEKITKLNKITSYLEEYTGEKVEYIDLRNQHNVFAKLSTVKLRLGEIDESLYERIKAIHNILPEIKDIKEKVKYVDLSWKDSKYLKME